MPLTRPQGFAQDSWPRLTTANHGPLQESRGSVETITTSARILADDDSDNDSDNDDSDSDNDNDNDNGDNYTLHQDEPNNSRPRAPSRSGRLGQSLSTIFTNRSPESLQAEPVTESYSSEDSRRALVIQPPPRSRRGMFRRHSSDSVPSDRRISSALIPPRVALVVRRWNIDKQPNMLWVGGWGGAHVGPWRPCERQILTCCSREG